MPLPLDGPKNSFDLIKLIGFLIMSIIYDLFHWSIDIIKFALVTRGDFVGIPYIRTMIFTYLWSKHHLQRCHLGLWKADGKAKFMDLLLRMVEYNKVKLLHIVYNPLDGDND